MNTQRLSVPRSYFSELPDSLESSDLITLETANAQSSDAWWSRIQAEGFAIVGTRDCSPYSERLIANVLKDLQGFPLVIVSGLARGIDQAAHRIALRLGFPCLGWIACGVDQRLTSAAEDLRLEILDHGGWIASPFEADAPAYPSQFLTRNGWIAQSSRAAWVVEAPVRSGALNTAKWAKLMNRDLYVTPCRPGDPVFAGNELLLTPQTRRSENPQLAWNAASFSYTWLEIESFLSEKKRSAAQPAAMTPLRRIMAHNPEMTLATARHHLFEEGYSEPEVAHWISDWMSQLKKSSPTL